MQNLKTAQISSPSMFSPYNHMTSNDDKDAYSIVIVEDLLHGVNDWRNVQDIVRLTLKAIADVIKQQGYVLRDLEKCTINVPSRQEINMQLQGKASIHEITETLHNLTENIDKRVTFDELQHYMSDYAFKQDFDYLSQQILSLEDVRRLLDYKANDRDIKQELAKIHIKLEDIQNSSQSSIKNSYLEQEIAKLNILIKQKPGIQELEDLLDQKANKQQINNILSKKANKIEIEQILSQKAELQDLDSKLDCHTFVKFQQDYEQRLDQLLNTIRQKSDQLEQEAVFNQLRDQKKEYDTNQEENLQKFEQLIQEIKNIQTQFNNNLIKKTDKSEFEKIQQQFKTKIDFDQLKQQMQMHSVKLIEDITNNMNEQKRNIEESVSQRFQQCEDSFDQIKQDLFTIQENLRLHYEDKKKDLDEIQKQIKYQNNSIRKETIQEFDKFTEEIKNFKHELIEFVDKKIDRNDTEIRSKFNQQLEDKVDLIEVQSALNESQADIAEKFSILQKDVRTLFKNQEQDILNLLQKKVNILEFDQKISQKVDITTFQQNLSQKANLVDLESLVKSVDRVYVEMDKQLDQKRVNDFIQTSNQQFEEIEKKLILKSDIKDVCTLLDQKSNIDDVNKALQEIHKDLEKKSYKDDVHNIASDQAIINESLCTENIVARWLWKSGEVKQGSLVPWEMQVINTLPDNFLWEKDKTTLLVVAPGLYEINCGFYSFKKPTIQILVNGEQIMSAVNNSSYVVHHTSGKLKDVKNSSGVITGLTLVDFILLPARSRISIVYAGEKQKSEGFISLKRL